MCKLTLVGTTVCPNCKIAGRKLSAAGMVYKMVYADTAEGRELAVREQIVNVPTLIVEREDGTKEKLTNVSNILKFIADGNL